jgi:WD40 repeat protein
MMRALSHIQKTVQEIDDPQFDYDVNSITRHLMWTPQPKATLKRFRTIETPHTAVTATGYFPSRDELVTAGHEGSIAVWGAPFFGDRPSTVLDLPRHYFASAVDGLAKGTMFVAVCNRSVHPSLSSPLLQTYVMNEASQWVKGEAVTRHEGTVVTNVKCINAKGAVFCISESLGEQHQLAFFSAHGSETRRVSRAHTDHIIAMTSNPENENLLFTGSRDTTVRVWDTRSSGSSPTHMLEAHEDTVTSIGVFRDVVMTTSFDGRLRLWDMRKLKSHVAEKQFLSPILRASVTHNTTATVATAYSLNLVSLFPLQLEDCIPNVLYPDLRANFDGSVIFAAGKNVDFYAVTVETG